MRLVAFVPLWRGGRPRVSVMQVGDEISLQATEQTLRVKARVTRVFGLVAQAAGRR